MTSKTDVIIFEHRQSFPCLLDLCLIRPVHTEQPDKDEIAVGRRIGCIANGIAGKLDSSIDLTRAG
jgi:hypothetical protein